MKNLDEKKPIGQKISSMKDHDQAKVITILFIKKVSGKGASTSTIRFIEKNQESYKNVNIA